MAMNNGGDATDEMLQDAKQVEEAAKTAKRAVKNAKNTAKNVKRAAKATSKAAGFIVKFFTTPPVVIKLIIVGIALVGLLIASLFNALNPFSTTNSPGGDNAEAQENDIAEDRGVDLDNLDNEMILNYPMDDEEDKDGNKVTGQYTRMASLLYEGINEAYERSASKYALEKANYANDPQYKTHDNVNKVYKWPTSGSDHVDDDYHNAANSSGIGPSHRYYNESDKPTMGEVPELEGNTWDDGEYLTDESQGGAVEQGIAYIIAAYSVSRGNTAPVAVEGGKNKYTYYNGLKALLKKDSVLDGFFEYTGTLAKKQKTQTVNVVKLKHLKHIEKVNVTKKVMCPNCYDPDGDNTTSSKWCTASCKYVPNGVWGDWDPSDAQIANWRASNWSTDYYSYNYDQSAVDSGFYQFRRFTKDGTVNENSNMYQMRKQGSKLEYKYTCPMCGHTEISYTSWDDAKKNLKDATYPYWTWEEDTSQNKDFKYVENSYQGNIAKFNDEAILEAMFLDDNDFYKDVQGKMATGSYMGGAASITAGESIDLPSGLGQYFTYMGWQCITSPSSNQYKLREAAGMNFDEEGFGIINGRYVIACTTTYGNVGDYVDFYQSDGTVLNCIIGDIKNQNDAGCNQWGHENGTVVVEFVVNKDTWYDVANGGRAARMHCNVGSQGFHMELSGKNIVKAVNGGNYFTNPDFVKDLKDTGKTKDGKTPDSSDKQLAVANLAVESLVSNKSTEPAASGWCAGWVSGIYKAAGLGYPGGNACDMWHNWKTAESTNVSKIPIGAIVYGGGTGTEWGHVGIYVGDTDGDGEGEVIDNWGGVRRSSISAWSADQNAHVDSYGEYHPAGLIGWVWPNKTPLGDGYEFTGIDTSNLVFAGANVDPSTLTRSQRLQNILASDYYQWGVKYKYECSHPASTEATCPECGAKIKIIKKKVLLFITTDKIPDFEYVKNKFPDFLGKLKENPEAGKSLIDDSDVYSVKEKIEYYQKDILDSIKVAKKYESNRTAYGGAAGGGGNADPNAGSAVNYSGNGAADAAPYKIANPTTKGEEVVNEALKYVGYPYVYGGNSLTGGIDCSGFIQQIYAKFGVSLPRTSGSQAGAGRAVSRSEIKPGDIIVYSGHVAMYIGNGHIVHASNSAPYPSGGIKIGGNAFYRDYIAIRRLVD